LQIYGFFPNSQEKIFFNLSKVLYFASNIQAKKQKNALNSKKCVFLQLEKNTNNNYYNTMKRLSIILMCFAALSFVSCSSLGTIAASDSAAKATGQSTANAILGLYRSYKANGTISLSNTTDLTNALALATGYTGYRNNQTNSSYKTSFAAGMVAAGGSLITSSNVNSVITTMNNLTGLNVNASNISQNVNTITSIITLLNALGTAQ
jgi:hypothetical protein